MLVGGDALPIVVRSDGLFAVGGNGGCDRRKRLRVVVLGGSRIDKAAWGIGGSAEVVYATCF